MFEGCEFSKIVNSELPRKRIYVIEMTYTTVGVKLVGMTRYGARFVVLKYPPPLFLSDVGLSRLNVERGTKISTRHVILRNTLFSFRHEIPELSVIQWG